MQPGSIAIDQRSERAIEFYDLRPDSFLDPPAHAGLVIFPGSAPDPADHWRGVENDFGHAIFQNHILEAIFNTDAFRTTDMQMRIREILQIKILVGEIESGVYIGEFRLLER